MLYCPSCGLENQDTAKFCNGCGASLGAAPPPGAAPSPSPAPGKTLALSTVLHGHYLILKKLAEGGMGAVYLARDTQLFNRLCVVKEMLPYYTTLAEKTEAEAKFEREARLLANLRHPGIPQVYDYFIEQNRYYLVMEFVDGDNLEEKLAQTGGPMPEREVIDYAIQVASVLVYISRQNPPVIHRDIKPANIIVDKNTGQVKLVDFGIAREAAPAAGPIRSSALGTPGYSPPEQYSHNTEPRSDVFALGATMHHLLTNLDPRQAPRLFDYAPLSQVVPGISPELEALVNRMLESNPVNRPTAMELQNTLKKIAQPKGPAPAAGPFAFRSGALAHDVMELAHECDRNWSDGAYHLYSGHFEVWLQGLNRYDLAGRAETIRKRGGDPNAGLEEFLRALNPTIPLPVLKVSPLQLNLGRVEKGDAIKAAIEIENTGRGYLHGDARTVVSWAQVTPSTFGCMPGDKATLSIVLDSSQLAEGNVAERVLTLNSNGGQTVVSAQFLVTWQPKLAVSVKRLDFGEVLEQNLGRQVMASFTISNHGGGLLEGRLDCPAGWLMLDAHDFRLLSGQSVTVRAMADSGQLSLARSQTTDIYLTSTGGNLALPARISIMKEAYKQRAARWGVYGALLLVGMLGLAFASALGVQLLMNVERLIALEHELLVKAGWLAGALVIGMIALPISARQIPLLDEIEIYYHQGDLVKEIPSGDFSLKRLGMVAGWSALAGLLMGASYNQLLKAAWWAIPAGVVAGALAGILLMIGSGPLAASGAAPRLGGVRLLLMGLVMAFLAALTDQGAPALASIAWWALVGMVLTSETCISLPLRLRWLLGHVRAGLLCILLAYLGWVIGMALIYRIVPSVMAFYAYLPGIDVGLAVRHLLVVALIAGGMVLGVWADNTAGIDRRRNARAMLWALLPGAIVAIVGFVLGQIVFSVLGALRAWNWGVLATVLALEAAAGWLLKFHSPQVARAYGAVRGAAGQAAGSLIRQVAWLSRIKGAWARLRPRWLAAPAGGWLADLTPATAVGVTGTLALLAPLATQIVFSLLIVGCLATAAVAMCLAVVALAAGVLVAWGVRTR